MNKPSQSLLALVFVLSFQAAFTFCFFYPTIIKWGATEELASTSLFGDEYADDIRSTRAIRINATQGEVWQCLVSLGADRKGFYSYYLLEYLFGCKVNEQYLSNNNTLAIGRLVPIKSKDKDGIFSTGFKVVGIKDKQALVLDGWGSFFIEKITDNTVQLIIRTHGTRSHNLIQQLGNKTFDVLHYVMEKRMLLGIKDELETKGQKYTATTDNIWMFTVVVSLIIGLLMVFIAKSIYKVIVPSLILVLSQYFSLLLSPNPFLGIFLLFISISIVLIYLKAPYFKPKTI